MASSMQAKRLTIELKRLSTAPPPGVAAWPRDEDRFDVLDAEIVGAPDTPYAAGVFRLRVNIPAEYPLRPPLVRFITKIYHPNIDSQGRICLDTLNMPPKGAWKPSLNVATVLASVQLLMSHPNPDDGLMADITDEFRRFPDRFAATAREWTTRHATQPATHASSPTEQPAPPSSRPSPPSDGSGEGSGTRKSIEANRATDDSKLSDVARVPLKPASSGNDPKGARAPTEQSKSLCPPDPLANDSFSGGEQRGNGHGVNTEQRSTPVEGEPELDHKSAQGGTSASPQLNGKRQRRSTAKEGAANLLNPSPSLPATPSAHAQGSEPVGGDEAKVVAAASKSEQADQKRSADEEEVIQIVDSDDDVAELVAPKKPAAIPDHTPHTKSTPRLRSASADTPRGSGRRKISGVDSSKSGSRLKRRRR